MRTTPPTRSILTCGLPALALGLAAGLAVPAGAAGPTPRTLALTGDGVPGGTIASFDVSRSLAPLIFASMGADGSVCASATIDTGAGPRRAVLRIHDGATTAVVLEGDKAGGFGAGVVYDRIRPAAVGGGWSSWFGSISGPGIEATNDEAAWFLHDSGQLVVLREGDAAPGSPGPVTMLGPIEIVRTTPDGRAVVRTGALETSTLLLAGAPDALTTVAVTDDGVVDVVCDGTVGSFCRVDFGRFARIDAMFDASGRLVLTSDEDGDIRGWVRDDTTGLFREFTHRSVAPTLQPNGLVVRDGLLFGFVDLGSGATVGLVGPDVARGVHSFRDPLPGRTPDDEVVTFAVETVSIDERTVVRAEYATAEPARRKGVWLEPAPLDLRPLALGGQTDPVLAVPARIDDAERVLLDGSGRGAVLLRLDVPSIGARDGLYAISPAGHFELIVHEGMAMQVAQGDVRIVDQLDTSLGRAELERLMLADGRFVFWASFLDGSEGVFLADVSGARRCAVADIDTSGTLTFFDLSAYAALLRAGDVRADLNGDGSTNFFDLSAFVAAFQAGCDQG